MRILKIIAFISLPLTIAMGQPSLQTFDDEVPGIKGKVMDGETGEPVEYATVSLLNAADSSLVGGMVTDSNGSFTIEGKPGRYILRMQFVSYKDRYVDEILFLHSKNQLNKH